MPGIDLLDAFAELVVYIVFKIPQNDAGQQQQQQQHKYATTGSDDEWAGAAAANSSAGGHYSSPLGGDAGDVDTHGALALGVSVNSLGGRSSGVPTRGSSSSAVDLYPGGVWDPLNRLGGGGAAANQQQATSSVISPFSTDSAGGCGGFSLWRGRGVGLYAGAGTQLSTNSLGSQLWTGYTPDITTGATSFVQISEEELMAAGGASSTSAASATPNRWITAAQQPPQLYQQQHDEQEHDDAGTQVSSYSTIPSPFGRRHHSYYHGHSGSCSSGDEVGASPQQSMLSASSTRLPARSERALPPKSENTSSSEFVLL